MASIDIAFKVYSDTPDNKDPDTYSRTLSDYHKLLWDKPLPCGKRFSLTSNQVPPYYMRHSSDLGDFWL
jgi:hypothetical protein